MAKTFDDDVRAALSGLEIDGAIVRITERLPRPLYERTDKVLAALGGKWDRKAKGHVFSADPTDAIENVLMTGEVVDLRRAFDFFETPLGVAQRLINVAEVEDGMAILEPSAGRGALVDPIRDDRPDVRIHCIELDAERAAFLELVEGCEVIAGPADFMAITPQPLYDRVIANPPFSRQQDVDHVTRMLAWCRPGGRVAAVMSAGVRFRTNAKTRAFRQLVVECDGEITPLPEQSFKASGTSVSTVLVTLNRPEPS